MVDLAAEVADAVASGVAGRLAAGGMDAAGRLLSALRARLRGDAGARGTLEIAAEDPDDAPVRDALEVLLRERVRGDSEFAAWLESLWSELGPVIRDSGRSANVISGTVHGNVIQARDIHGGIHLSHSHGDGSTEDGNAG